MIKMDVNDDNSVKQAVDYIARQTNGRIDAVINNA